MNSENANRLLNTACELITELEEYARLTEVNTEESLDLSQRLEMFFKEVQFEDDMLIIDPDAEAQDESMGRIKIWN